MTFDRRLKWTPQLRSNPLACEAETGTEVMFFLFGCGEHSEAEKRGADSDRCAAALITAKHSPSSRLRTGTCFPWVCRQMFRFKARAWTQLRRALGLFFRFQSRDKLPFR